MTSYFKALVLGLGLAAGTLPAPAQSAGAEPGERSISVRVSIADLDITFASRHCGAGATDQAVGGALAPTGGVGLMAAGPRHRGGLE